MTVKVSKAKLIQAIQAERARVIGAHETAAAEAKKKFGEYRRGVLAVVAAFVADMKAAKSFDDITAELQYGYNLTLPKSPGKDSKPNTTKFDKALAQLALVEDDSITLNDNRDSDYLALIG